MPSYRVTDPETGRTLKLTGDSPPTEQELEAIFSRYSAEAPSSEASPEANKQQELEQQIKTLRESGYGASADALQEDLDALTTTGTTETDIVKMSVQELEGALERANSAALQGDQEAIKRVEAYDTELAKREGRLPEEKPEPTLAEKAVGVGETGATLLTGATTGLLGMIEGTAEGIAKEIASGEFGTDEAANRIEQLALERASQLTYQPGTESGKEILQETAQTLEPLAALGPQVPIAPELRAATTLAKTGGRAAVSKAATSPAAQRTQEIAGQIAQAAKEKFKAATGRELPGKGSAGAAAVAEGELRQAQAQELPVSIKLTEGQKSRDFAAQKFERETAKLEEVGAPLRERFDEQNRQIQQNFDEFIDQTGAELTTLRGVGESVFNALKGSVRKDKSKIRTLYKEAEKSGEMQEPVQLSEFVKHLNDSTPEAEVANVLKAVRAKAIKLGAATEDANGELVPGQISLKDAELLRRSINAATNQEPTNIRQAGIMKGLIDDATELAGGNKYKRARRERMQFGKKYENVGLIKNILGTKRGSDDRAIALEDVVRKSVLEKSTSLDTLRHLRRLLQTEGEKGQQAWKELQGATLRHIQDRMTKGVALNSRGEPIVSPAQLKRAVEELETSGKLAFLFGKKGAEQLETIKEVAQVVLTSPPGSVNTSNTATALLGLMDIALASGTGIPAPIASGVNLITKGIKSRKLKMKVQQALGNR